MDVHKPRLHTCTCTCQLYGIVSQPPPPPPLKKKILKYYLLGLMVSDKIHKALKN